MPIEHQAIVQYLIQRRTRLLAYAWTVVSDRHVAEDVFQDVSMAVVRKADQIEDAGHLDRWVKQAIRLRGLEIRRNRRGKAELLGSDALNMLEQAWDRADARADDTERTDALRRCIDGLSGNARDIIELRYGQSLKPQQIAARTDRPVETIYKIITRSHHALRDCINRRLEAKGAAS